MKPVYQSLVRILEYLHEEEKHYLESDQPSDHIYRDIMRVRAWLNENGPRE